MRSLTLLLALVLAGCASKVDQKLDLKTANTRAVEQRRMNAVTSGSWESASDRGDQVLNAMPKEFNMGALRNGFNRSFDGKAASTNDFHFVDHTRTKGFGGTKDFYTKGAWLGDAKFATKSAPTKSSWFGGRTARVKSYETKEARDGSKSAAVRALPEGDLSYVAKGRRQAQLDANGRETIPMGTHNMGPSWTGDLKPLTIEDVKGLLNKN